MISLPVAFLVSVVGLTLVAGAIASLARNRRAARLADLAHQWHMRFAAEDRFDLTPQVAARLPATGAADVSLRNLVYTQEQDRFRYYFTVEFTAGVLRRRTRRARVAALWESRQRSGWEQYSGLRLAPDDRPIVDQYRWLHESEPSSQSPVAGRPPGDAIPTSGA